MRGEIRKRCEHLLSGEDMHCYEVVRSWLYLPKSIFCLSFWIVSHRHISIRKLLGLSGRCAGVASAAFSVRSSLLVFLLHPHLSLLVDGISERGRPSVRSKLFIELSAKVCKEFWMVLLDIFRNPLFSAVIDMHPYQHSACWRRAGEFSGVPL